MHFRFMVVRKLISIGFLIGASVIVTGCQSADQASVVQQTATPTLPATLDPQSVDVNLLSATDMPARPTLTPGPTPTWAPTATNLPAGTAWTCDAADWQNLPVVPEHISQEMLALYAQGLNMGNDAHAISVIGDCQNVPSVFLGALDDPQQYRLGDQYAYLQAAIDWFSGSFSRKGAAVSGGFNVATVLSQFRADPQLCQQGESPLECELRLQKPSIVIVSMETWWSKRPPEVYEGYMRQILDTIIAHGAVPILATKADNLEGDNAINLVIAELACEYKIPLWNFWSAADPLPSHGLWTDGFHLTVGQDFFDDPNEMLSGRTTRNLTALQALNSVWRAVSQQSQP